MHSISYCARPPKCNNLRSCRLQNDEGIMKKRTWIGVVATFLLLCAVALYAYLRWGGDPSAARASTLAAMPAGASAVMFADLAELRQSPFAAELYAWAPQPQV